MAEVTNNNTTSTYDYSMIGSVGGEAAQSVNGDMINKIRAAEEKSVIDPLTTKIENITLEAEKIDEIKTKLNELQGIVEYFDIGNDDNVFNQFHFDAAGTSAVFDAVDKASLEEGTTTVKVNDLAMKDVFQSSLDPFEGINLDDEITFGQALGNSLKISIEGVDDPLEFFAYTLNDAGDAVESAKTYRQFAEEINSEDGIQASFEAVGTDANGDTAYRLIIKSEESGLDNSISIEQNGIDLGFADVKSATISNWGAVLSEGSLTINGQEITDNMEGLSYTQLMNLIDAHADFEAEEADGTIKITAVDGSEITIVDSSDNGLNFANTSHIQTAQNLSATIDGVSYDSSSNSITTLGSLKITAIEEGTSTITISRDTSAISVAAEAMITQYNSLQEMINDEIYSDESVIEDKSMLRGILQDLKTMLFQNYGAEDPEYGDAVDEYNDIIKEHSNVTNNEISLFQFGFNLDKSGNLSLDKSTFNDILNRTTPEYYTNEDGDLVKKLDFDAIKNVFTGSYTNKGVGVQLKEYIDALDGYGGTFTSYEESMVTREEELEEDKKDALERLDTKYGIMAEQFSAYSAIIAQMEASFSGLKMMIEQSVASN